MKNPKEIHKFCKKVKELRKKAGLTQEALAYEADISSRAVQKIEAGKQTVSIDIFFSLARALHIQPSEFMEEFTLKFED